MPLLPTRKYLTRKEAAQYLTEKWFQCSPATLRDYACDGIGPAYSNRGAGGMGEAMYTRDDLDAWAPTFLKPSIVEQVAPAPKVRGALSGP